MTYYFNVAFDEEAGPPEAFRVVITQDYQMRFTHLKFEDFDGFEAWSFDDSVGLIEERDAGASLGYTQDSLLSVTDAARPVFISMLAQCVMFTGKAPGLGALLEDLLKQANNPETVSNYGIGTALMCQDFGSLLRRADVSAPIVLEMVVSQGQRACSRLVSPQDLHLYGLTAEELFSERAVRSFVKGYIAAALFSCHADGEKSLMQLGFTRRSLSVESSAAMQENCRCFIQDNWHLIPRDRAEEAGRDFWFNRNGHGAGFWDGDWPEESGELLSKASKVWGSCDLYLGDDGKIHST